MIGLLNLCCSVLVPGLCFLRRLIDLRRKVTYPCHHIFLSDTSLDLYTDAAGCLGYGAVFKTSWFHGTLPPQIANYNITFKKLFPFVPSLEIWGPALDNKCIVLHSDNYAVVHITNKQSSKDSSVMKLVRRLGLVCMQHN